VLRWQVAPIAFLFCVGCADRNSLPDAPRPPTPVTTESQVVGCYQHIPGERPMSHVAPWDMPRTFYLTAGPFPSYEKTLTLWWVKQASVYRGSGHWRLTGLNTIEIVWSTGFQGVRATLRRGSTDDVWRGRTVPFSDDGIAAAGVDVSVRSVEDSDCDSQAD
jgi:hypothetical protein